MQFATYVNKLAIELLPCDDHGPLNRLGNNLAYANGLRTYNIDYNLDLLVPLPRAIWVRCSIFDSHPEYSFETGCNLSHFGLSRVRSWINSLIEAISIIYRSTSWSWLCCYLKSRGWLLRTRIHNLLTVLVNCWLPLQPISPTSYNHCLV